MTYVALGFCLLISALGVIGVVSPGQAVALVRRLATQRGIYFAGVLRIVMGIAFYLAAPTSRAPHVLSVLGIVIVVVGVVTFFVRAERFQGVLAWWEGKGPALVRGQGVFAIAVGLLLAWSLLP